jgi:hypothetical protein
MAGYDVDIVVAMVCFPDKIILVKLLQEQCAVDR